MLCRLKNIRVALGAVVLCAFASFGIAPGDTAPDFSVPTVGADTLTLSDYDGSIRVLFFFGCG